MFAGKHGFITPRDLFKWAGRGAVGYQELADNGYLLLGERLRTAEDRAVVQRALEKQLKVQASPPVLAERQISKCSKACMHSLAHIGSQKRAHDEGTHRKHLAVTLIAQSADSAMILSLLGHGAAGYGRAVQQRRQCTSGASARSPG